MSHFAILDKKTNTVVQVIRVDNGILEVQDQPIPDTKPQDWTIKEDENRGIAHLTRVFKDGIPNLGPVEDYYFKQTSYNADGTNKKWYNFAGIGHKYDKNNNAFVAPKPTKNPLPPQVILTDPSTGVNGPSGKDIELGGSEEDPIETPVELTPLAGTWELDEKFRWVFIEEIKIALPPIKK
jgi:hypothetical protein